jgi:5,10-methylenetetrahydromethanopterin reductase
MVGVISHIANPTIADSVSLAKESEAAGASWMGVADAFWWRDSWMALASIAVATSTIEIGPTMTNPYLRHPFHTISALATLRELAPGRTFVGVTAGGSEVTAAAGVARTDAAERVHRLVDLIREVGAGDPLDRASGRGLDVPFEQVPVVIAGRGDAMLRTAGRVADRVLLWAIPDSDLERTVGVVSDAASDRARPPDFMWAPLVEHDPSLRDNIMHVAVYAALNTKRSVRESWGLDDALVEQIRARLVAGETAAAKALVPESALDDLLVSSDPSVVAARARSLGCTTIAVPGYSVSMVGDHVSWATSVESLL